jgi:hypothetical protein
MNKLHPAGASPLSARVTLLVFFEPPFRNESFVWVLLIFGWLFGQLFGAFCLLQIG